MSNQAGSLLGIDVPKIEREMRELWEGMGAGADSHEAVMRTCVLNLVVYAPGVNAVSEVSAILAEVTTEHPSRCLLLLPRVDSSEDGMSAMVTAQCHAAAGGRQQICCEQIMINASGAGVAQLPSAVRPLLVTDLPTVLWWRANPNFSSAVFQSLVDVAGRVILDSSYFPDSGEGFRALSELVGEGGALGSVSDLSWGRMGPWRRLVAGFYNTPENRPHLGRVGHVAIECGRVQNGQTGIPVEALLTASWLSSRLKWKPRKRFEWIDDATCQVQLDRGDDTVVIEVKITDKRPGLHSIRLVAGGDPTAAFTVQYSEDGSHLETQVRIGTAQKAGKVARVEERSESVLLARELEILGADKVFEQALGVVGDLAN